MHAGRRGELAVVRPHLRYRGADDAEHECALDAAPARALEVAAGGDLIPFCSSM